MAQTTNAHYRKHLRALLQRFWEAFLVYAVFFLNKHEMKLMFLFSHYVVQYGHTSRAENQHSLDTAPVCTPPQVLTAFFFFNFFSPKQECDEAKAFVSILCSPVLFIPFKFCYFLSSYRGEKENIFYES